jgi:hypothetical protein
MGFSVVNPKTGRTLFLHIKKGNGNTDLYVFAYEIVGSVEFPHGFILKFSPKNGQPYLIKKRMVYGQTQDSDSW